MLSRGRGGVRREGGERENERWGEGEEEGKIKREWAGMKEKAEGRRKR